MLPVPVSFLHYRQVPAYIETGKYKKVIIVGADKMSSITDYTDRTSCPLFGDAAGAVLLEPGKEGLWYNGSYFSYRRIRTEISPYESWRIR